MSLCTVGRRERAAAGEEVSAGCARDALGPVSPVVGSRSAGNGDMDVDVDVDALGLGCSFALFLRWRTLCCRRATNWYCDGWQYDGLGSADADSEETSICPLCDGFERRGEDVI